MPVEELARQPDGLIVRCLRNIGPYENNIFIVSDAESGEAYVLDGGFEPEAIAEAANGANFARLAAGTLAMALVVLSVNRLLWRRLYSTAEQRFHLD